MRAGLGASSSSSIPSLALPTSSADAIPPDGRDRVIPGRVERTKTRAVGSAGEAEDLGGHLLSCSGVSSCRMWPGLERRGAVGTTSIAAAVCFYTLELRWKGGCRSPSQKY